MLILIVLLVLLVAGGVGFYRR